MIVVIGEALIDLVTTPDGTITAALGGAPFNTARTCGRLGASVRFAGVLSTDRFGTQLAERLVADGVEIDSAPCTELPTTLAAAELDSRGTATYRFYVDGTSAPSLSTVSFAAPPEAVFTGGLALVLEPMASSIESALATLPAATLVMVDVNCRPAVVPDRDAYVRRLERMLAAAHVIKVSDEDLAFLAPGIPPLDAARQLLDRGPRLVLLTAGGAAVHLMVRGGDNTVPVPPVELVDTIGAGDAFAGGFLAWWQGSRRGVVELDSIEVVTRAVEAAIEVAGITCTRRGAEPPWRDELARDWPP